MRYVFLVERRTFNWFFLRFLSAWKLCLVVIIWNGTCFVGGFDRRMLILKVFSRDYFSGLELLRPMLWAFVVALGPGGIVKQLTKPRQGEQALADEWHRPTAVDTRWTMTSEWLAFAGFAPLERTRGSARPRALSPPFAAVRLLLAERDSSGHSTAALLASAYLLPARFTVPGASHIPPIGSVIQFLLVTGFECEASSKQADFCHWPVGTMGHRVKYRQRIPDPVSESGRVARLAPRRSTVECTYAKKKK